MEVSCQLHTPAICTVITTEFLKKENEVDIYLTGKKKLGMQSIK
jgi:hypothetical protein